MRQINSKSIPFRLLLILMSLVVFATLPLAAAVDLLAEDCDDEGCDECTSVCGCINCPPPLVTIDIPGSDQAALPGLHSKTASDSFFELKQEWFDGIERPPRISC